MLLKRKKNPIPGYFLDYCMGYEALKCTFLCCTYILTTLKAKIMTTGPRVLERNNYIVAFASVLNIRQQI